LGGGRIIKKKTRVGADVAIAHVDLGEAVEPGCYAREDAIETGLVDGLVEIVPMHRGGGFIIADDEAVFGTTAREGAGVDDQGSGIVQDSFLFAKASLFELLGRQLVVWCIGKV